MKLSAREVDYVVRVLPESPGGRPIRIRLGPFTFCLDLSEAIDLASRLADAVTQLNEYRKDQS